MTKVLQRFLIAILSVFVVAAHAQYTAKFLSPPQGTCARFFAEIKFTIDGPLPLHFRLQDDLGNVVIRDTYYGDPPPEITTSYDPLAFRVPDGPRVLTLDVWGSEGSAKDTLLLNIDKTPPQPNIAYPLDGQCVNGVVTVRGSVTDNFSGVEVWELRIDGAPVASGTAGAVHFAWSTTGLPDHSVHTLQVLAYDKCGNFAQTPPVNVRVNNRAPTLSNIYPSEGSVVRGIVTVSANIHDGPETQWSLSVNGSYAGLNPPDGTGATIVSQWDTSRYPDGLHNLEFTVSDGCGNRATTYVSVLVSNGPTGGDGGACRRLKNLIVSPPGTGVTILPMKLFRPQTIDIDGFTIRDVLVANDVSIGPNLLVQRVRASKETPLYKCGGFVFGPGSGLNTNFTSGWVFANSSYLDRSVVDVAFRAQGGKLGNRALLFSPPGTTYRLQVTYVTRLENGRISLPRTVEICWTVVIEDRNDLHDNVRYFSTVAAGATQKPKISEDVAEALHEAIAIEDPLEALVAIESVVALAATNFSTLRDRRPHALFAYSYLIDSDEEPIGCLLIEQANALLWR